MNDRVKGQRVNPRCAVRRADHRKRARDDAKLVVTELSQHAEVGRKIGAAGCGEVEARIETAEISYGLRKAGASNDAYCK